MQSTIFFFVHFCFLTEEAMFSWKIFFSRYLCQSTENSLKRGEMWFLAGVRMYACVPIWNLVRQWSNHNPIIVTIFMTIDARFVILWDLEFFEKGRGSSNVREIRAIVLKLHSNILHPSRNFAIQFGQNRLKRSNFFRFWIFWEFFSKLSKSGKFRFMELKFCG